MKKIDSVFIHRRITDNDVKALCRTLEDLGYYVVKTYNQNMKVVGIDFYR